MKIGGLRFFQRSALLAAACMLALLLTACTGKGGGQLPPQSPAFKAAASFGFSFSCEDKGGLNPPPGQLHIELSYTEHGTYLPAGSPFSIHGIVDTIDSDLESEVCSGNEPVEPSEKFGNQLIFLGRYRVTSGSPSNLGACPTRETTTSPLCRFEVIVRDNDEDFAPSPGDYFSIKLSTVTQTVTNDCPPDVHPPCFITEFPDPATVPYARAGKLKSGNITVD